MRLGSSAEAAESQEYLVKTFLAAALPTMEEDGGGSSLGIGLETRHLATLQTTNTILINGGEHGAQNQSRRHAHAQNVKVARAQHPVPMDIDPRLRPLRLSHKNVVALKGRQLPCLVRHESASVANTAKIAYAWHKAHGNLPHPHPHASSCPGPYSSQASTFYAKINDARVARPSLPHARTLMQTIRVRVTEVKLLKQLPARLS
ncbi:hypothetical protein B0H14DRAFT_3138475 [Mycena olivaceomarginata]|nr:hypothetical protein B0H14DRAFT_3138475 [Mycena olivaceomarginata]